MKKFKLIVYTSMDMLRATVRGNCQKNFHIQQVAYSVFHDALTQVCFTCERVRTTIQEADVLKDASVIEDEALNEVQGEETFDEIELTFPDNEALADFLIQGSNEAEVNAACFQEAYKRLFKVA